MKTMTRTEVGGDWAGETSGARPGDVWQDACDAADALKRALGAKFPPVGVIVGGGRMTAGGEAGSARAQKNLFSHARQPYPRSIGCAPTGWLDVTSGFDSDGGEGLTDNRDEG